MKPGRIKRTDSPPDSLEKPTSARVKTKEAPGRIGVAHPKPVRLRSREYLEWLHLQPCVVHGRSGLCDGPLEAAHITIFPGSKSAASKVSDYLALPMCRRTHELIGGHPAAMWCHGIEDPAGSILRHLVRFLEERTCE